MRLTISKQFRDLIYPLTEEELAILEQSILKEGVRDPLVIWENGRNYLIDGHHRWSIITKHKITRYKTLKLKFGSKHDVINWILDNQLGRRNATPEGISYLRGLRYKNEKLMPHRPKKGAKIAPLKTSERLAEHFKIAQRTIYNDEQFADAVDAIASVFSTPKQQKDVRNRILTRQLDLSKKDILELSEWSKKQIIDVVDKGKDLWQVRYERQRRRNSSRTKHFRIALPKDIKLIVGDCLQELKKFKKNSIDSCLTDPPYGISFMGKDWDNFSPESLAKRGADHKRIDHKKQSGRSASMHAGLYDTRLSGCRSYQQWCQSWAVELMRVIKPGGHILVFCSTRMYHRLVVGLEEAGWEIRDTITWNFFSGFPKSRDLGKGMGTNLKPAMELVCLARKPISETTLEKNVKKWGTGGLNIEACRIGDERVLAHDGPPGKFAGTEGVPQKTDTNYYENNGRYPANTIFDEQSIKVLSRQSEQDVARFFYCPKTSLTERNFGCEDLPSKKQNSTSNIRTYNDRCGQCGKKFIGPQSRICQCPVGEKITNKEIYTNPNNHPTVKPIDLCRYLVRLITPPGGTCLDIFAGSGSTGIACVNEGFNFVGIEKEKEYYQIARRRIMAAYRNRK